MVKVSCAHVTLALAGLGHCLAQMQAVDTKTALPIALPDADLAFDKRDFAHTMELAAQMDMYWTVDEEAQTLKVGLDVRQSYGWVGLGIGSNGGMMGADMAVLRKEGGRRRRWREVDGLWWQLLLQLLRRRLRRLLRRRQRAALHHPPQDRVQKGKPARVVHPGRSLKVHRHRRAAQLH